MVNGLRALAEGGALASHPISSVFGTVWSVGVRLADDSRGALADHSIGATGRDAAVAVNVALRRMGAFAVTGALFLAVVGILFFVLGDV